MTPIPPAHPEPGSAPLLAEDQVRLGWLGEDLTSCLGEIGEILRRASGGQEAPSIISIAIDSPAASSGGQPSAPPLAISWTRADGAACTYDWQSGALHCARQAE